MHPSLGPSNSAPPALLPYPQVANLSNEETPQIYAACGHGARSTLCVLRPGLAITGAHLWRGAAGRRALCCCVGQLATNMWHSLWHASPYLSPSRPFGALLPLPPAEMAVSPLPGNPTAVWTIKRSAADEFDAYIVVSFSNATLVLRCAAPPTLPPSLPPSLHWKAVCIVACHCPPTDYTCTCTAPCWLLGAAACQAVLRTLRSLWGQPLFPAPSPLVLPVCAAALARLWRR